MSDLVGNPEDRFSHNGAHIQKDRNESKNAYIVLLLNHLRAIPGKSTWGGGGTELF